MTYGRKAILLLFAGDLAVFAASLWVTLLVRYGELPDRATFAGHIGPFSILFALWILVFYMAGLYSKRIVLFKSRLWGVILRVQLLNIMLAALFFFFVPNIGIAPKTNLVLYLFISLAAIFAWRLGIFPRITRPTARTRAALIGSGAEAQELIDEVNANPRYHLAFPLLATPTDLTADFDSFARKLNEAEVSILVVDTTNDALRPLLARIYELALVAHDYQFLDFYEVYEEVFDRVPLSLLQYEWFLQNVTDAGSGFYAAGKRALDLLGGSLMAVITLILIPFVWIANMFDSPGPLFIAQDRIGLHGTPMKSYKFRSMRFNDAGSSQWVGEHGDNPITHVGSLLRITSLDEFPQFLNILRGELSLIGPRNDIAGLASRLADAIPYYNIRYVVKPGITGWAQINQQYAAGNISPQSIEETKMRLAYDFYYIKNRSLILDILIALRTVKRMLFRVSSW